MKLALAYSHKDAHAALRLLVWLAHLGGVKAPVLAVATQRAARQRHHPQIDALLKAEFPGHEHRVCRTEDERGWPWSCSHLFVETLQLAGDDVFFLEPDCVPMRRGWFEELHAEYKFAQRTFMGARVPAMEGRCREHMTGVAFYGRDWERAAPSIALAPLATVGKLGAWDVDCADEILRDFHPTTLIQHLWRRNDQDRSVALREIAPQTALFHQCKDGDLFAQIDPGFASAPLTLRWLPVTPSNTMPRYFLTENASVPLLLGGEKFQFEPVEFLTITNSWWGVLSATDESQCELLENAAAARRISELTKEEYDRFIAKKKSASGLITFVPLKNPLEAPPSPAPAAPAAPAPKKPSASVAEVLKPRPTRSKK